MSSRAMSIDNRASAFSAVLFDLDDTLIDRSSAYEYAYRCFYDDTPAIHNTTGWEEALEFFWSLSPWSASDPRDAFLAIREHWPGITGSADEYEIYYYERLIKGMRPFPEALKIAEILNKRKVKWGIITNGGPYQRRKLAATTFDKVAPFFIISSEFGVYKPNSEIFLEGARMLDVSHTSNILFVGDNPYTDIEGAHSVGMFTAWLSAGRQYPLDAPKPDYIFMSIGDTIPLLDSVRYFETID